MGITKNGWEKRRQNGNDVPWNKGKKLPSLSDSHKEKIRNAHIKSGLTPPNWKGKKRSLKMRERLSESLTGKPRLDMRGINNPLWKGGVSEDFSKYMKNYRRHNNEAKAGRKQPEQCEICGAFASESKRGLNFDHDHKTGEFRGWICMRCNTAIGLVKENTETLQAIIKYLKTWNGLA